MEIVLENVKQNDWELTTTLSSNDMIGITGPEYEELLNILTLKKLPEGKITIDNQELTPENYLEFYKKISIIEKQFKKMPYLNTIKDHMDYIINYYHLQIKNIGNIKFI